MCQISSPFSTSWVVPKNQSKSGSLWNVSKRGFLWWGVVSTPSNPQAGWPQPYRLFTTAYSIYSQLRSISVGLSFIHNQRTSLTVVTGPTCDGDVLFLQAVINFSNVLFGIDEKKSRSHYWRINSKKFLLLRLQFLQATDCRPACSLNKEDFFKQNLQEIIWKLSFIYRRVFIIRTSDISELLTQY